MTALPFALAAAGTAAAANPTARASGYRMPDEGEPHRRTWMAFTSSRAIWGADLPAVQQDLVRIAHAIAAFEPVTMLVNADAQARATDLLAKLPQRHRISLLVAPLDDLWMRDTGPVFVKRVDDGSVHAVNFNFNGWGNKQKHARDATVAATVATQAGVALMPSSLVLEGGALEVDGQGTAILKESCVLNPNRNPSTGKQAVEAELQRLLGIQKTIWLPGPAGGDITDAHTDFYARFAGDGTVVVSHDANDVYGERAVTQRHIDVLRAATDAAGRPLRLQIIPVPDEPQSSRANDESFAAGYINYYLCNGAVIAPLFGDRPADAEARTTLTRLYPRRQVVQLRIDAIAAGGGGIHCATQQEPMPS